MGRLAAYTAQEVRWLEVLNSDETFEPVEYGLKAPPPTLPDANGDYPVPARGRRREFVMG